ncbi:MAG: monovalent cation/H+ antiporter complex subunit F [Bacteroidales bacterium]
MNTLITVFLYTLIAMCFLCFYRVVRGPTIADRLVAIDILGIIVVGITAIIAYKTGLSYILDIGIAWIMLSFIGTLTLAKYLWRNKLNE